MTCAAKESSAGIKLILPQGWSQSSSSLNWNIPEFDTLCTADTKKFERIYSPMFMAGEDVDLKSRWCLGVDGMDGSLSCYLYFEGMGDIDMKHMTANCTFKIGLGNNNNSFYIMKCCENMKELRASDGFGFELMNIKKIFEQKEMLLEDNTLRLCLQLVVYGIPLSSRFSFHETVENNFVRSDNSSNSDTERHSSDCDTVSLSSDESIMSVDISSSHNYSDIKIKCRDRVFYCHKQILSARIPNILKDEFDWSPIDEKKEIVIEDMQPSSLAVIIQYIYTGTFDLPEFRYWSEVLFAAEKYELKELKEQCYDRMFNCEIKTEIEMICVE